MSVFMACIFLKMKLGSVVQIFAPFVFFRIHYMDF